MTDARTIEQRLSVIERRNLRRIIKALEFYADPATYLAVGFFPDPPCGPFMKDFDRCGVLGYKPGKRARAALKVAYE